MRAYIFGTGEGEKCVKGCILESVIICGYIDNYKADTLKRFNGKQVVKQQNLECEYDYIIITVMEYEGIRDSLIKQGIEEKKIISFFDFNDALNKNNWKIIDSYKWRTELMWKHYISVVKPFVENIGYEIYADSKYMKRECPRIMDAESTADILKKERKSLARFGDGEFEIICGRSRAIFQDTDDKLSVRLKEVLESQEDNLLIAIANNYGSLEMYTDDSARDIRMYMTKTVREDHMSLLDLNRQYYDAFISRPYMIFRDKENAGKRFRDVKKIWDDENVLVVEGIHTRFGVGNDLLDNAKKIERIVVPDKNAFQRYNEIRAAVYEYGKNKLILASIGPTATVLAYDLAKQNYWIIDIGQLDTEYEWFLCQAKKRCKIKNKNVSEVISYEPMDESIEDDIWEYYNSEIIERIL